jgi:hypothetical protein
MSTFHDIGVKDQSSQAEKTFIKRAAPTLMTFDWVRLSARVRRYQVVRTIVDNETGVLLGAVLDGEHPGVGAVDRFVFPRIFRNLVQPGVVLLLNQVRTVRDCLLNPLHYVGFRLVSVAGWVVLVLSKVGSEVLPGKRAHQIVVDCGDVQKIFGEGRWSFCSLKSHLFSGKSWAMATSLFPMSFHISKVSSAREFAGREA